MASLDGILLGMGNPLLDISAKVPDDMLTKYGLEANNAILVEDGNREKVMPIYQDMKDNHSPLYFAGGATQNSIRVAQWMLQSPGACGYIGCIGNDDFGVQMATEARASGMTPHYMVTDKGTETGTCACLINGAASEHRSLVANLAAANEYSIDHLHQPEIQAVVEKAQVYYSAGFFLTVCPDGAVEVGQHAVANNKIFCGNFSAPFLLQVPPLFEQVKRILPYWDYAFGNETECDLFAQAMGWTETDRKEIAKKISALPKENTKRPRIVVITQGADPTIVFDGTTVTEYPITPVESIKDTNGAGDAFVGGFLSQLVQGKDIAECVRGGNYGGSTIIQHDGCAYPEKPDFK